MGGKVVDEKLKNGATIALAHWETLKPTEHGTGQYNTAWSQHKNRDGLAFYESTVQYMRNDWAAKNMHAEIVGDGKNQNALLFYHKGTKTWHTADALDIDHAAQWKDHLKALKIDNMAEAQKAYNDVNNLRLLPSVYNRARDSADDILSKHGPDSKQWKQWVDSRLSFDNTVQYREFDPEGDSARRTKVTKGQDWTESSTRAELSFDKRVMDVWFNKELEKNFVGTAAMTNPDGSGKTNVPLFRCAATGQLCTRDALDIDHAIPLEQVLKKMHEMFPKGFSKADALDAYNDTSNLRLVGRSANSSHEWELMPDGHFRDSKVKEIPGEFKKFIVEDGPMDPHTKQKLTETIDFLREGHRKMVQEHWAQQSGQQSGTQKSGSALPLVNQTGHPDNAVFQKVVGEIAKLDPQGREFKNQDQRDRMASALMVMAKLGELPGIDHVMWNSRGDALVAVSGDPKRSDSKIAWLSPEDGLKQTVERNTESLAKIPAVAQPMQVQGQAQTQTPHQH